MKTDICQIKKLLNPRSNGMELTDVSGMVRDQVVPYYVDLIINFDLETADEEVKRVNDLILSKWKPSGLLYIKEKAWKRVYEIRSIHDIITDSSKQSQKE